MKDLTFVFHGKGTIRWEDIHELLPRLDKETLSHMDSKELTSLWEELSEMDHSMKEEGESGIIHKVELPPEEPPEEPNGTPPGTNPVDGTAHSATDPAQSSEDSSNSKQSADDQESCEESSQEENLPVEEEVNLPDPIDYGDGMYYTDLGGGWDGGGGDVFGGDGGVTTVSNKPKLIISNYELSPATPKAGQEFELHLTFTNTNADKSVRNIKISLSGSEAALPSATPNPLSDAASAANTATGGGSVFTPVDSSNTFYIARINPEETADKTIRLRTAPTIAAQNYAIHATFEYEDADGNEFTATEMIGIPVVQASEILLGEVQITGDDEMAPLMVDTPAYVNMDVYNIGKDALTNFMVTISGEGFEVKDSPRYFIGNFAVGATDHFYAEILPNAPSGKGTILVTYEDSTGAKHEEKSSFDFTAEEMTGEFQVDPSKLRLDEKTGLLVDDELGLYYDATTLEPVPAPEAGGGVPWLPIGIGLIVIVAIILFIRRRNKKKRQQEELNIDA